MVNEIKLGSPGKLDTVCGGRWGLTRPNTCIWVLCSLSWGPGRWKGSGGGWVWTEGRVLALGKIPVLSHSHVTSGLSLNQSQSIVMVM